MATRVYSYQAGKAAEEFGSRPRSWEADHDLLQIAIDVEGAGTWGKRLSRNSRRPATHFKPIAAGKVVLDARNVPLYAYLRRNFNDAVAITMDSDEIAQAGHLNRSLPVMAICGISDPANGTKAEADRAGWQPIAAA